MIVILVIAYSAFFRIHDVWNIQMEAAVPVHVCVVVTKCMVMSLNIPFWQYNTIAGISYRIT